MTKGTIFSIEEFAVNDGPGIRTTIFLKGCPLRCSWCHNPEGQSFRPEPMIKKGVRSICGYEVDAADLAGSLLKNKEIFRMNEGGVTFTGGEPLAQPAFLLDVLRLIRPEIHCTAETSAYVPEDTFRTVIGNLDLVLMDIKLVDGKKHEEFTGKDNSLILRNLDILKESCVPFIIRIPLIPGVNDTLENLSATAELISGVPSLLRVELLPYNLAAGAKYPMVGKKYEPGFDTKGIPQARIRPFEELGIQVIVK